MGSMCCDRQYNNDLSYIDSLGAYIKCVLDNLTRVQADIANCSQTTQRNSVGEKEQIKNTESKSYSQYQYYILLIDVLIKLKIISEDYYFLKKNDSYKEINRDKKEALGVFKINFKEYDFNLETATKYLANILNTEDSFDIKELDQLNKQMVQSLFIQAKTGDS